MSVSRTDLKLIGLNDDQIESVIAAHSETVSALKQKYSELEAKYNSAKEKNSLSGQAKSLFSN